MSRANCATENCACWRFCWPRQTGSFPRRSCATGLFSYAESVSDNAIEVYIARLRKKLEGSGARIETVRGLGYRISAG